MENCSRIEQILPAAPEWFCVTNLADGDRWFIDRVVAWALVRGEEEVDHVRAIPDSGLPNGVTLCDIFFVYGLDASHQGRTWQELFESTAPSRFNVREITHLFR